MTIQQYSFYVFCISCWGQKDNIYNEYHWRTEPTVPQDQQEQAVLYQRWFVEETSVSRIKEHCRTLDGSLSKLGYGIELPDHHVFWPTSTLTRGFSSCIRIPKRRPQYSRPGAHTVIVFREKGYQEEIPHYVCFSDLSFVWIPFYTKFFGLPKSVVLFS